MSMVVDIEYLVMLNLGIIFIRSDRDPFKFVGGRNENRFLWFFEYGR
jgi:hypothetical protein